jgi:S-adenosylmethionine-diacylgycerolhomoserine-N-methlytransferase
MDHSTSPGSRLPEEAALSRYALAELERFYRIHARIYDWTRPFLLFGRRAAARSLAAGPGDLVLDVGCGTGFNLKVLGGTGARVVGIESAPAMRARAEARLRRVPNAVRERFLLDSRPYGSHDAYAGRARGILFSYSLSMIPPFEEVLGRARADLAPGGRVAVVDFLDALPPVAGALRASHVFLGPDRLRALERMFPVHRVCVRTAGLWRYFVFLGGS